MLAGLPRGSPRRAGGIRSPKTKSNLEVFVHNNNNLGNVLKPQTLQRTNTQHRHPYPRPRFAPLGAASGSTTCLLLGGSAYMASRTCTRMPLLFSVQSDGGWSTGRPTTAPVEGLLESCCCCAFLNSLCCFGSPLTSRTGAMASGLSVFRGVVASSPERGISPIPNGSRSCSCER